MKHHLIIIICVAALLGALLYMPLVTDSASYAKAAGKASDKQTEKTAEKTAANTAEVPAKPKLVSVQSMKVRKATVTWEAVEGAEGYEIRYQLMEPKDEKSGKDAKASTAVPAETKTVTSGKKTTATLSNLLGGRDYKVKIRSYCMTGSAGKGSEAEGSETTAKGAKATDKNTTAGSSKVRSDWSKAKTVTVKHTRWSDLQDKYIEKKKVKQLIFVKYKGNSKATLILYTKVANESSAAKAAADGDTKDGAKPASDESADGSGKAAAGDTARTATDGDSKAAAKTAAKTASDVPAASAAYKWEKVLSCDAYTGQNGIDKVKEGDRKTPTGVFTLTHAFGVEKDPGSKMDYIKLNKNHYWCGDRDHYNQMIDIRDYPHNCRGEHLVNYTKQYAYAMAMNYNKSCTYGKGSAIFLHCTGYNAYTLGCVAVSKNNMKKILQTCGNNTKICIYRK